MRTAYENDLIQKVDRFVVSSFQEGHHSVYHLQRTAYWIEQLQPNADVGLVIAALTHDMQRSEQSNPLLLGKEKVKILEPDFLDYHQQRSAELIGDFLRSEDADSFLIERVKDLVRHHEVGGDADKNLLKDADSVSYFENCIDFFVETAVRGWGIDTVRKKIDWMYNRIDSNWARSLAQPHYELAVARLKEFVAGGMSE